MDTTLKIYHRRWNGMGVKKAAKRDAAKLRRRIGKAQASQKDERRERGQ
jgi:hypothetical protein